MAGDDSESNIQERGMETKLFKDMKEDMKQIDKPLISIKKSQRCRKKLP